MSTNPINLLIPAGNECRVSCDSHAAYIQYLTVTVGGFSYYFSGTGEGVAMKLPDSRTMLSIDPSPRDQTASFLFTYGPQGPNGPRFNARHVSVPIVRNDGGFIETTISSEDATDNDDNDTYVTVICLAPREEKHRGHHKEGHVHHISSES